MKVFKFYSDDYYYAYSGHNEDEARLTLLDDLGEMEIDKVEEIPESEWGAKIINVWEDNLTETVPYRISIRENMGEIPGIIFTNDLGF